MKKGLMLATRHVNQNYTKIPSTHQWLSKETTTNSGEAKEERKCFYTNGDNAHSCGNQYGDSLKE